jgi:hypothetical protein
MTGIFSGARVVARVNNSRLFCAEITRLSIVAAAAAGNFNAVIPNVVIPGRGL